MSERDPRLVGEWTKLSAGPCASRYPGRLRFEPGGLYHGVPESTLATWWDQGSWNTPTAGEVDLSTFNDAVVRYRYSIASDTLAFVDAQDCRFSYRRVV